MKTLTLSAAAVAAIVPFANALGSAIVINKCSSNTYLYNTPSSGGGGVEVDKTLAPGASYSQVYQALTNGNGWSLKLSPTAALNEIMQFEYTYQGDGTLWYDISYVNGDPFNGDWVMSSDNPACVPKQTYYRYSTDNAYGMQSGCSPDTSITVTLCPGGSAAPASSAPAPAAPKTHKKKPAAVPAPAPAPSSAPAAAPAPAPQVTTKVHKNKGFAPAFAPAGTAAAPAQENVFTTFVTQVVTVDYTAEAKRAAAPTGEAKRDIHQHQHHPIRHQHGHY